MLKRILAFFRPEPHCDFFTVEETDNLIRDILEADAKLTGIARKQSAKKSVRKTAKKSAKKAPPKKKTARKKSR